MKLEDARQMARMAMAKARVETNKRRRVSRDFFKIVDRININTNSKHFEKILDTNEERDAEVISRMRKSTKVIEK